MSLQKAWILAAIYAIGLGLTQASAEVGVTADTIRLGQVCALTGPAQGLGQELKAGATAYFEHINRQGGIHGRKIRSIGKIKPLFTPSPPPAAPLPPCRPPALRLPGAARAGAARGRLLGLGIR
jgi:Periplasmic binding protein